MAPKSNWIWVRYWMRAMGMTPGLPTVRCESSNLTSTDALGHEKTLALVTSGISRDHASAEPRKMAGVVERMACARAGRRYYTPTPDEAKAAYEKAPTCSKCKPHLNGWRFRHPARDGAVRAGAALCAPSASEAAGLLFFHGGGFAIGVLAWAALMQVLKPVANCPSTRSALQLAHLPDRRSTTPGTHRAHRDNAFANGTGRRWIAIGGDSAGTLATCAILARSMGYYAQLLFYPGMAAHQDTDSRNGPLLGEALIGWFSASTCIRPERDDWPSAPLNADDLERRAPAWIGLAVVRGRRALFMRRQAPRRRRGRP